MPRMRPDEQVCTPRILTSEQRDDLRSKQFDMKMILKVTGGLLFNWFWETSSLVARIKCNASRSRSHLRAANFIRTQKKKQTRFSWWNHREDVFACKVICWRGVVLKCARKNLKYHTFHRRLFPCVVVFCQVQTCKIDRYLKYFLWWDWIVLVFTCSCGE